MIYILTKQYHDKSGFYIYGATQLLVVAKTWAADSDDHFVYAVKLDEILQHPVFTL